ncbi:hypothetical protein GUJ93_ZPchr0004g40383 [Zizania palustris]|uniref:Uncharacterized protein n=1 Tax=Zizania palustris TaxID=103762 RepID=A0A8J5V8W1_ZIZPA|nr:hypothetical protein GUJ93_ZPchr0004g40383 [Zizania palustris]
MTEDGDTQEESLATSGARGARFALLMVRGVDGGAEEKSVGLVVSSTILPPLISTGRAEEVRGDGGGGGAEVADEDAGRGVPAGGHRRGRAGRRWDRRPPPPTPPRR